MSKKWASYTFSLFQKHEMSYTSQGRRENKPQTFSADGWTGNQRSSQMWWRNEQELLSPEPRTVRNKWAEWLGRGEREGDKGGLLSRLVVPTGTKGYAGLLSRLDPPTGTKGLRPPASLASRWTRDKYHLLSRAQRLPGQMAWNKGLFCSSVRLHFVYIKWSTFGDFFSFGTIW